MQLCYEDFEPASYSTIHAGNKLGDFMCLHAPLTESNTCTFTLSLPEQT